MHAWHFKYEGVLLLNKSSLKHIWSIISSRGKAEKISNWSWIFKAYHNSNLRLNEKAEEILAWIKKKKIQIRVYLEPAHKTETYLRECGIQKHYNYSVTFITHWETWRSITWVISARKWAQNVPWSAQRSCKHKTQREKERSFWCMTTAELCLFGMRERAQWEGDRGNDTSLEKTPPG